MEGLSPFDVTEQGHYSSSIELGVGGKPTQLCVCSDVSVVGDDVSGSGDDVSGSGDDVSGSGDGVSGSGDGVSVVVMV